jgi:hypothetical protein
MSTEQRMLALANANTNRSAQAEIKSRIKREEMSLAEALVEPVCRNLVVWALVKMVRGLGPQGLLMVSTQLARQRVPIGYQARVGSLTARQRIALVRVVSEKRHIARSAAPRKSKPARKAQLSKPVIVEAPRVFPELDNPPPRCRECRTRLLKHAPEDLCGFCLVELAEVAA